MTKHQEQLESVLDYLINGELTEAEDLLHRVVVEKSKHIYESLVHEEEDCDEMDDEDELEEGVGGDPKSSYADDIQANKRKVKSEEFREEDEEEGFEDEFSAEDEGEDGSYEFDLDGNDEGDEFGGEEDFGDEFGGEEDFDMEGEDTGEIASRMEDVEAALAELTAEFHEIFADELGDDEEDFGDDMEDEAELSDMGDLDYEEPAANDDMDDDMEDEDEFDKAVGEALEEATAFLKATADAGMKSEGNEVAKGKSAPVNTNSVHATSPRKDYGGKPVDFAGGSPESGGKATQPKDENAEDNVKVPQKKAPAVKTKPVGDDKSNTDSLLSGAPGRQK